jgi:hypothetical protein
VNAPRQFSSPASLLRILAAVLGGASAILLLVSTWAADAAGPTVSAAGYAGSQSCRECHERFYDLWSTSHHGLAMQPYTSELARTRPYLRLIQPSENVRLGSGR